MRHYTTILALFLTTTVFGQTKDRRAVLDIQGRVNEISVSPDEKIWLVTAMGNTYYTNNIDSNWHYGQLLFESMDEFSIKHSFFERISFFNKDTAILTGYIFGSKKESQKNGYYLTMDAGKTWKLLDYGGDSWIYNTFVDKNGNAWMGGSSGDIYFSKDFGQNWVKLNSPYDSSTRMHSIFMNNSTNGVSGAVNNDIYITNDNWKSFKKIATPYDQKKYTKGSKYTDNRINKVLLWNNFIVVNQNGYIYYTEVDTIDWKVFPIEVFDFELDNDSKILFAVTYSLKIALLTSPTEYQLLAEKKLSSFPIDMKIVNHSLFIVSNGNDVYKVNQRGLTHIMPFTTDKPISKPQIVKHGANLTWGANGNQIYLSEKSKDWYRENSLDIVVSDFMLLNDSVAILWDNIMDIYLYSIKDHTLQEYFPESPLKRFLSSPVKKISINSGYQSCLERVYNEVNYERVNDSTFATTKFSVNNNRDKGPRMFENKVNENELIRALFTINGAPTVIPGIKDFKISKKDKKNYLAIVDKQLKSKDYIDLGGKKKNKKKFYYSVPQMLDTLNGSVIKEALNQRERILSRLGGDWFEIQIVNENNDTLKISRNHFASNLSWKFPWKFEYNGLKFNCYNIEFSRFVNACIPEKFIYKELFENKILIMKIADYLYNKEEERRKLLQVNGFGKNDG